MVRVGVIGGGPAAAMAALILARGGADVTVFSPPHQREKPCGGAVPEGLLAEIEGLDWPDLPSVLSRGALIENAYGGRVLLRSPALRIFRRGDLDPAFLGAAVHAGARPISATVRALSPDGAGVTVAAGRQRQRFDWIVAADGARGVSRRALGLAAAEESFGLGASLEGVEATQLVLFFPHVGDAYLWIFPRPGGVSVGIAYGGGGLSHGAAAALLGSFLERHLDLPSGSLPRGRYRYPIPQFSSSTLPALRSGVARRILLAGDAAALVDPLTREGIRYAVRSGRWAAESLLAGSAPSYPERVAAELGAEMSRARRARRLFFEEPLAQWMVPLARYHPGIAAVLSDLLTCRQPYRGLRRRLLRAAIGLAKADPTGPGRPNRGPGRRSMTPVASVEAAVRRCRP